MSSDTKSKKFVAHLVGVIGFIAVGLVTGIAYIIVVGKILDKGGDGFGLAAAIVTFPILAGFGSLLWILFSLVYEKKAGPLTANKALLYSFILGLLMSLAIAGFRGFTMHGGSTLFNYFIIAFMVVGALLHRFMVAKIAGTGKNVVD